MPAPQALEQGNRGICPYTVFGLADKVVDAVKKGQSSAFVMAGCDGRMRSREYYTEFASSFPRYRHIDGAAQIQIQQAGLGRYRRHPRVLDAGQCNDSYSLALIALKLKEAFGLDDVNSFPFLTMCLV